MASSECCEVPGRAWPGPCWEGQGGQSLILNPLIRTGQWSCPLHPSFQCLALQLEQIFFLSGCLGSAVGAGSEETLSSVVPWPWGPPVWVTCVLLAKGLQKTGQFPLPVAVILLCRGCSRGKAGSRNFVDSSYSPGAVSS